MSEENKTEEKKKKGGIFSGLSSIFFEEAPGSTESDSEEIIESASVGASTASLGADFVSIASISPTPSLAGEGVFDNAFNEILQKVIESNDIPGIDYLEFNKALKQMSGTGIAEPIAFQTVFTTLKVSDPTLTKSKLTSAVDHYISVLRNEEKEFNSEMTNNTESEVGVRRAEAESLNNENQELVKKIQEIQEKISQNQQRAIQLNSEAANFEAKFSQNQKNFVATLAVVISTLENDKNKIEQLVKE